MGLHVRTITPYALPGVLALLACWWFFSRKKDRRSTKPDHTSACVNEEETVDALEEVLQEETQNDSKAQFVPLEKDEEILLQDNCACSLPLAAQNSLYSMQSNCRVEGDLVKEPHLKKVSISQGFADQKVDESKRSDVLRANEVEEVVGFSTSSVLSQSHDDDKVVKHNPFTSVENLCTLSTGLPCGWSQADEIQDTSLKVIDPKIGVLCDSELLELSSQPEVRDDIPKNHVPVRDVDEVIAATVSPLPQAKPVEKVLISKDVEINLSEPSEYILSVCHDQIQEVPGDPVIQQTDEPRDIGSEKPCSHSEGVEMTQSDDSSAVIVREIDRHSPVAEMQVEPSESLIVQCGQSIDDKMKLAVKGDVRLFEPPASESILSEQETNDSALDLMECHVKTVDYILQGVDSVTAAKPSESGVKSSISEVVKEGNCTDLIDTFSKCLEKKEVSDNLCPVVDNLKEAHPKTFLGDYEAKIVEQLAINLISKVIVAARQEILSSSVSDVSDSSCQILNENRDTKIKQVVPESEEDAVSANFTLGVIDFDCTCESAQFEPLQNKNLNTELTGDEFCLEHQREEKYNPPSKSVRQMPSVSDISPVHRRPDFFEESQPAMEESSLSVCTSEECINMDDPLQSTVLSTVSGGYNSMSSSGIELSRETFNMSIEKPMNATCGENDKELYSNGDLKRGSPDLSNDGNMATESEVDHSGGSDVNSMDSVDSGYALGNSEQFQNVKQKSDLKKADLVIWEFEVPKYLVGRLIGKQGRFVSFLKQSSGAKIYISTVPYTQDIQICHLEGSQQQIDRALSLIRKKFKDLNLTNIFAPPPPLIPLPVASWLTLPNNVSVEVVVVNVVNAGHMFVQQRTHPTFHALCGLDQHMSLCYAQPGIPTLPTPAEVGILCAAPVGPSVWWRAQVMAYFEDTEEVEILYVDYGGYNRVKIDTLRQIRSDFVSLPFQGVEVLLDNVIPLGDEDHFSSDADAAVKELTRGAPMLTQVTNYDEATRLPLVQLWRLNPDEMVSVNRTLVERGFAEWIDSY